MNNKKALLSLAIISYLAGHVSLTHAEEAKDINVVVRGNVAEMKAKRESQQKQIITSQDIEKKQAKSAEDIVFNETGITRTVDAMGRVGVSIRGAEPRHTLILVDGQPVVGEFAKYQGDADELMRIGTENLDRIEITQGAASAKYGSGAMGGVINVITKKPANDPGLKFNIESLHNENSSGILPNSNFFLRADSGKIGKAKFAIYGSKRDILPVYPSQNLKQTGLAFEKDQLLNFPKNSLRFFGESSNLGLSSIVDLNENNSINLRLDKYTDNLQRFVKHSDSFMEPQINYRRHITRDNYNIGLKHSTEKSTLNLEANYARLKEKDLTLTSYEGRSIYEGNNILNYVDTIDHEQYDIHADIVTAANDKHTLKYGFGVKKETGEGSRLKSAPEIKRLRINPWDYDKNLYIDISKGILGSKVHDYILTKNKDGIPYWDPSNEWYGYDSNDPNTSKPAFTYEEYNSVVNGTSSSILDLERALNPEQLKNIISFGNTLLKQNPSYTTPYGDDKLTALAIVQNYYNKTPINGKQITFNGKPFQANFAAQDNQITVGRASINKQHLYIQDDWRLDDNTVFTPSLRLDHSNLFGSNITFNLGATHNLHGKRNTRLKANIGTGYAEPGLGELYYNWEMFGATPIRGSLLGGTARLGWYWAGNPDLKPEKSINMDLSIEGETKHNSYRATIFKNRIKNYLTAYFTGQFMDFSPEFNDTNTMIGGAKWLHAPDMIYSFKNIGEADITGLEAEIKQKLGPHWSARLGYTYLRAINKSDAKMPRQLLNKPRHKIDIGISYQDDKTGWFGTLYGNYYIKMLDSNEISGGGNELTSYRNPDSETSVIEKPVYKTIKYKEKTYGTWNLMIQKKFKDDTIAYFGIDNLFNHRDDYKALQGRLYRFGLNFKFGKDGKLHKYTTNQQGENIDLGPVTLNDFITTPYTEITDDPIKFYGEYKTKWNIHDGINRPLVRANEHGTIGNAEKNMIDPREHGFEQELSLGLAGRVAPNTKFDIQATATSDKENPTSYDVASSGKLSHLRLTKADVTNQSGKWNYSAGRLKEKIGISGTWFNQSYDGIRAVYTKDKTQIRLGYGDFSHSTGIMDSPYTKIEYKDFLAAPTVNQFLGVAREGSKKIVTEPDANHSIGFYKQLVDANGDPVKQTAIIKHMLDIVKKAYPNALANKTILLNTPKNIEFTYDYGDEVATIPNSLESYDSFNKVKDKLSITINSEELLSGDPKKILEKKWENIGNAIYDAYYEAASSLPYNDVEDLNITKEELGKKFVEANLNLVNYSENTEVTLPSYLNKYWNTIYNALQDTENSSKLPREKLAEAGAGTIKRSGIILSRDSVPAIEKAAYIQLNHQLNPKLGINAWYLRSTSGKDHNYNVATFDTNTNSYTNTKSSFNKVANVFGIGAKYQLGHNTSFTLEYGINTSPLAKYLNGTTSYQYVPSTYQFNVLNHQNGRAPRFFNIGFNIGYADINKPGTWEAFANYRRFEHGSFFGGNGTDILPDRYLDGIASYSIGGKFIPNKNLMLKMSYTFGAKGLKERNTIYGPESFKLGNYSRIEMVYKF